MNLPLLIRLLFHQKWWCLLPVLLAPLFAVYLLLTSEPAYVSGTKLWVKKRGEESTYLRIERSGSDTETHIGVQSQIIKSNRILGDVMKADGLEFPPPSQSPLSKLLGRSTKRSDVEPTEVQTLKALHGTIDVSILNPEILIISARMNDPALAQKIVQATLDSYIQNAVEISVSEIDKHEEYLTQQLGDLEDELAAQEKLLTDFESLNPEIAGQPGASSPGTLSSPTFARETTDVGAVPLLARKLAELELRRNELATTLDPSSFELQSLEDEIAADRRLLQTYLDTLSEQAKLAVQHDKLQWKLLKMRDAHTALDEEIRKVRRSRGGKLAEQSGITVLDSPSYDDERVSPKRKNLLLGSIVLGTMAGLGLLLLRTLFASTYAFRHQIEAELGLPVLGEVASGGEVDPEPEKA